VPPSVARAVRVIADSAHAAIAQLKGMDDWEAQKFAGAIVSGLLGAPDPVEAARAFEADKVTEKLARLIEGLIESGLFPSYLIGDLLANTLFSDIEKTVNKMSGLEKFVNTIKFRGWNGAIAGDQKRAEDFRKSMSIIASCADAAEIFSELAEMGTRVASFESQSYNMDEDLAIDIIEAAGRRPDEALRTIKAIGTLFAKGLGVQLGMGSGGRAAELLQDLLAREGRMDEAAEAMARVWPEVVKGWQGEQYNTDIFRTYAFPIMDFVLNSPEPAKTRPATMILPSACATTQEP
jgi:hypothetical protein